MKKADKTRIQIQITFLRLAIQNNQIPNVSEICLDMDIYRSTFYNYYSNIEELIEDVGKDFIAFIDEIFEDISLYQNTIKQSGEPFNFTTVLVPWVDGLRKNIAQIAVFFNPAWNFYYRDYMMQKIYDTVLQILSKNTAENRYIAEFISAGTIQYIYAHISNNEPFTTEEFTKVWNRITLLIN